jgi:oligoribonuclease (3'-5' exoribonuclease)
MRARPLPRSARRVPVSDTLLFLDVATSGYDAQRDQILEIACMLVRADDLEILDVGHWIVLHLEPPAAPEFHAELVALCGGIDAVPLRKVEAQLLSGQWGRASRLVGRGVDFDRKFLTQHLPTFARELPRQTLDLNQLEYFATRVAGAEPAPKSARTYRAEDDLAEAYEALRYYAGVSQ